VLWMALAGLAALAPASARAAAWAVDDTTDTPVGQACPGFTGCSLREAVTSAEANPGADAILVTGGTYVLTNGQLSVTADLTVARVGASAVTIDGNDASRMFDVTGAGTSFTVRSLTLTGGHVDAGPGIGQGGAIRTGPGTDLHVESAALTGNSAAGDDGALGGAIFAEGDVFVARASGSTTSPSLTGNSATSSSGPADGGALAIRLAEAVVDSAVINANTASGASANGGAIYGEGDVVLVDSTLSANHATGSSAFGGAVANDGAMTSVTSTTLSSNTATGTGAGLRSGGGAVAVVPGAALTDIDVNRSTLAGNRVEITGAPLNAVAAGGALYDDTIGTTQVTASTVTGNTVAASGASTAQGAAFSGSASGGSLGLAWSIVVENTGASQCAQATISSFGYNVLGSLSGCTGGPAGTDVTGVTDAGLSPLADHGGLTQTRLVVEPSSPALDLLPPGAGTCTIGQPDQRGVSRPQGDGCEAGAAESRPASLTALPATRDWGNVPMSGAAPKTVSVSNSGEVNIVTAPVLSVAAPFSASGCAGGVPSGGSCLVSVQAAPATPGTYAATLTITAGTLSDTVDLQAVGFGPTTMPAITPSDDVAPGTVLTVGDGAWTGSPTGFDRQWVRCDADGVSSCADLPGQTGTTYTTTAGDDGHRLRVRMVAHSATVDSDPIITAPSGLISASLATPTPAPTPTPSPEPTPAPAPSPGDAMVRCSGRELTILDFRPNGRRVTVRGLALTRRSGQTVTLRAGAKPLGSTTVAADGSFTATVPLPRSGGRPRLTADVEGSSSQAFAVERRFTIVARKRAGSRVRVTARVAGGKRGATVTLRRQVGCGRTERYGTARLGKGGRFTIALPLATAAESVALYRAVAPIAGGTTFTLPIAVTASG
jgi:predicted outer membrane repeat protein